MAETVEAQPAQDAQADEGAGLATTIVFTADAEVIPGGES